jgi:hypothetical protein
MGKLNGRKVKICFDDGGKIAKRTGILLGVDCGLVMLETSNGLECIPMTLLRSAKHVR